MALALTSNGSDRKGALSFRLVIGVFFGLMLSGLLFGLLIHRRYVGFERVVAHHVPPDAALVLRWDVEKVSLFEPTRRFLLPLFDAQSANRAPVAEAEGQLRRDRIADRTELQLGRDLREALVSFGPGPNDWSLVLGGSFPDGDVLAQGLPVLERDGFRKIAPDRLQTESGFSLGRAANGVIVIAPSPARLDAALLPRPLDPSTPRTGAGSLVIHPDRPGVPEGVREVLAELGDVREVQARAEWGSPLSLEISASFRGPVPPDVADRVHRALGAVLLDELPRLEHKFGRLRVEPTENGAVRVRLKLDDIVLEALSNRLAHTISGALALRPVHN